MRFHKFAHEVFEIEQLTFTSSLLEARVSFCLVREPSDLQAGGPFSVNVPLKERRLSSDSIKASSGDVSPYDNNSPVPSDGLMGKCPEDGDVFSPRPSFPVHFTEGSPRNFPVLATDKGTSLCLIDGYKRQRLRYKLHRLNPRGSFVLVRGCSGSYLGHLAGFPQRGLYAPSSDW